MIKKLIKIKIFNLSDVITISLVDCFTSIMCGCTVFSVLGYIAKTQEQEIENVVRAGPGLVFMVILLNKLIRMKS